jgi:hypothetical protein
MIEDAKAPLKSIFHSPCSVLSGVTERLSGPSPSSGISVGCMIPMDAVSDRAAPSVDFLRPVIPAKFIRV